MKFSELLIRLKNMYRALNYFIFKYVFIFIYFAFCIKFKAPNSGCCACMFLQMNSKGGHLGVPGSGTLWCQWILWVDWMESVAELTLV